MKLVRQGPENSFFLCHINLLDLTFPCWAIVYVYAVDFPMDISNMSSEVLSKAKLGEE